MKSDAEQMLGKSCQNPCHTTVSLRRGLQHPLRQHNHKTYQNQSFAKDYLYMLLKNIPKRISKCKFVEFYLLEALYLV